MTPERIRDIRKGNGLSYTQLAAILRVSDLRTVRRWEKGQVPISGPASILLELIEADELPDRFWWPDEPVEDGTENVA